MPSSSLPATVSNTTPLPDAGGQVRLAVPLFRGDSWQRITDVVTCEETVNVFWEQESGQGCRGATTLTAWPHEPELLALGHALLDGCPASSGPRRSASVKRQEDGSFRVRINDNDLLALCSPPVRWEAPALLEAMDAFIRAEGMWDNTGCFHRAGVVCPATNRLLVRAEDIGRHNCVDRLAGWSAVNRIPLMDKALLVSARLTESLCSKALRAGFRLLVGRSAVTTAAVAAAEQAEATLIGFARTREQRFTVFTDPCRRVVPTGL